MRRFYFNYMEDACKAIQAGEIPDGTVIVLRYEGPKGGPGMREMHMVTSLLVGRGMDESCVLVKERTPSLAKYAALVTSADRGAILEIPASLK